MLKKRWQDWVTLVAGLWFAVMPWTLGHGDMAAPVLYNALAVGLALALFSAGALARPQTWEEVVDFLIGLWMIASPWVFNFSGMTDMSRNAMATGLLVAVLAGWNALERSHVLARWRHHA